MNYTLDEKYMARCLELAKCGEGNVAPNPMVGAVVVYKDKIIGEGYHREYGKSHAEVNAIASVENEELLKESTLYVSLEPCSHYGKTPPCAELIIKKQIPKVVIATLDPFPQVSGRGVRMLQDAGIEVSIGMMEKDAIQLNKEFITFQTLHRPYIYLKWAESADRFIDITRTDNSEPPVVLSNSETMRRVHKLRSQVSAIMVGTNTAFLDNPSLNVRHWQGKSPVRVVVDRHLRLNERMNLFDGTIPTLVFTEKDHKNSGKTEYIKIDFTTDPLNSILNTLYKKKLNSLMVEGGAHLLQSFIDADLWDEAWVESSSIRLFDGVEAPRLKGVLFESKNVEDHLIRKFMPRRDVV